jgi:O-antigen/teichoic acid export membrane protein
LLRTFPEMNSLRAFLQAAGDTWQLSKWLLAQQTVAWLGASGHGWILAALLGPANFGIYRATYQIVNILNPMRQAATNHLPSSAARTYAAGGVPALRAWQLRTLCKVMVPFIVCALAIALAAEPLSRLLYGEKLQLANLHWLVALGALGYAINFARTPLDYAAMVAGGARQLFLRMLWLTAFVASVGVTLIATLGISGAFMSEVAAGVLSLLLTLRLQSSLFGPSSRHASSPDMARIAEAPR